MYLVVGLLLGASASLAYRYTDSWQIGVSVACGLASIVLAIVASAHGIS